ncbi:NAD-dependent succinate-semialdehyde dehydrogenase [Mycolicibacterium fortuitum]|uniref:NAD-dependent succinate-semialdehyde dehydrogenase n=1 Tax=Mycolicibacterium fortuitum TaxID=1766 RepID=UPI0007E928A0|nr:NAD-dependent succinate-semialdehyde dehydrogenase [Mycolicibacterium fortuitum]OBB38962.1 NAD-dependent succinate-semialdehyde dehydrogenase [Mycolicibacterium fortuitum]OBB48941.1 NAD-dependent succinate-semialdehyde dehydrogenase [Mycolicibacterium fortuitum]OBB80413.1 NAD-dependent succinate-semialdehyde dehydrogenase [Mycolicibacterium fortuitum]OBF81828.1 NAD-dependent succinate-semialdehyde dehydrogenase [Mycolicibacterium fortuitum]OBG10829.1 NAD-dependent succinate-semialdehyde deh
MNTQKVIAELDAKHGIVIDGQARGAAYTFEVHDPATGRTVAEVADGTAADARSAVDAAHRAFPGWAKTSPRQRSDILRRVFDLMIADTERLTALICAENGKSQADARAEVGYAAEFFRWFSEEAVRTDGAYGVSPAGGTRTVVTHKPVGVAALVTPWNFPAAMATRKIAPALAAGCTVVLKPAAETPLTALAIAGILSAAGVPDGVVNLVPTTDAAGVVENWLSDDRIRKVSFTGSTGVGRVLLKQAAERIVNASMELGGNAPFIVTADADVDAAIAGAMVAKFRGGGQACTAANRFYVHASVVDEFVAGFGAEVSALRVGPASDPASQIGPLVSERAAQRVAAAIDAAVADGAVVAAQAQAPTAGWFVAPTLLTGVAPDAAILADEIFGPVAPVVVWNDEDELPRWANDTEYGLAAYVYAGRLQDAVRLAEALDAGMVGINRGVVSDPSTPFGGMKQSGLGREGARIGMHEFQETQYFSVAFD